MADFKMGISTVLILFVGLVLIAIIILMTRLKEDSATELREAFHLKVE